MRVLAKPWERFSQGFVVGRVAGMSNQILPTNDITGRTFGQLTVERYLEKRGSSQYWECRCSCGVVKPVSYSNLGRQTFSCGCRKNKKTAERNYRHGLRHHPLFHTWRQIHQRCEKPKHHAFPDYGARGIYVCARWSGPDGLQNFIADMGDPPSPTHSVDRRDNDGPYSPDNCHWATKKEQARNSRRNRLLTVDGRTQCVVAWAEETGINPNTLRTRLRKGWTPAAAVTTPVRSY
jgi:hypothetical protein